METDLVTFKLVKKTHLEEVVESGDKAAINEVISIKEKALENATTNANFWARMHDEEKACEEAARANRIMRDIEKLKAAI